MEIKIKGYEYYVAELYEYDELLTFKRKFLKRYDEHFKIRTATYKLQDKKVYEIGKSKSKEKEYFYVLNKKIVKCTKESCIRKFKKEYKSGE